MCFRRVAQVYVILSAAGPNDASRYLANDSLCVVVMSSLPLSDI